MKTLILCGGDSSEYEISINSAKNIIKYVENYEIWILKGHKFYKNFDNLETIVFDNNFVVENLCEIKNFDKVFPIFHGKFGEDGCIQGLCEIMNVPYVGCNVLSSAICSDKGIFKNLMRGLNIPVVPYKIYTEYKEEEHEYPVMVKPCNGGSSIGITKVNNKNELKLAFDEAFKYDKRIIVEKWIDARELECSVLEKNDEIIISSIGEIKSKGFYDYESKYLNNTEQIIPAELNIAPNTINSNSNLYLLNLI